MAQCTAHSSRTGERCKRYAILGGNVCRTHGGAVAHVKARAQQRIIEAADQAAGVLIGLMRKRKMPHVQLGACKDLLDRAGLAATQKIEHSGSLDLRERLIAARKRAEDGDGPAAA